MHILGISCFFHDAAAAVLKEGLLVAAAEEERFTRKKHDYEFPHQAIRFCLKKAGIRAEELDVVVGKSEGSHHLKLEREDLLNLLHQLIFLEKDMGVVLRKCSRSR